MFNKIAAACAVLGLIFIALLFGAPSASADPDKVTITNAYRPADCVLKTSNGDTYLFSSSTTYNVMKVTNGGKLIATYWRHVSTWVAVQKVQPWPKPTVAQKVSSIQGSYETSSPTSKTKFKTLKNSSGGAWKKVSAWHKGSSKKVKTVTLAAWGGSSCKIVT